MGRAMEMILTGEPISAEQALSIGLVNRVVDDQLKEACNDLAQTLIERPRRAIQFAKEAVLRFGEGSLELGLSHESYLHALSCGTHDKGEGVRAFLEKRKPNYRGD